MNPIAPYLLLADWTPAQFWLLAGFAFVIGACFGSFLNVVVYRTAAGLSLVRPASRCPHCETPIRAADNLPIIGWLKLRGKCRACGAPIAVRYPLVELIVALVFLSLVWYEPLSGGTNLPREVGHALPQASDLLRPSGPFSQTVLWALCAFHLALLCRLFVESQWEQDGYVPTRQPLYILLVLVAFVAPIWCPWLHPVPASPLVAERLGQQLWAAGMIDTLVGGVVACVLGMLATPALSVGPRGELGRQPAMLSIMLVGLYLGWQATTAILVVTAAFFWLVVVVQRAIKPLRHLTYTLCLFLVSWGWVLAWRPMNARYQRLADAIEQRDLPDAPVILGIAGGTVLVVSLATWLCRKRPLAPATVDATPRLEQ